MKEVQEGGITGRLQRERTGKRQAQAKQAGEQAGNYYLLIVIYTQGGDGEFSIFQQTGGG